MPFLESNKLADVNRVTFNRENKTLLTETIHLRKAASEEPEYSPLNNMVVAFYVGGLYQHILFQKLCSFFIIKWSDTNFQFLNFGNTKQLQQSLNQQSLVQCQHSTLLQALFNCN
ncbi:Hypothetical_protein [Hexamita inflata]|uniref:Hypothetical_protein n=1 Tax=Hexamita inflata TaxID=28002 RepID=A0AA86VSA2_9EUKA|nr:Hypothetical protein HINF_LOCUS63241 [Hexamita inflata]CAI9975598.1 Hypothetical protein HINF_LOCUS63243 [Hexamita inflata]